MSYRVIPVLRIFDYAKTREFYIDWLGFTIDWEHRFEPDAPLYLQVSREHITLIFLNITATQVREQKFL